MRDGLSIWQKISLKLWGMATVHGQPLYFSLDLPALQNTTRSYPQGLCLRKLKTLDATMRGNKTIRRCFTRFKGGDMEGYDIIWHLTCHTCHYKDLRWSETTSRQFMMPLTVAPLRLFSWEFWALSRSASLYSQSWGTPRDQLRCQHVRNNFINSQTRTPVNAFAQPNSFVNGRCLFVWSTDIYSFVSYLCQYLCQERRFCSTAQNSRPWLESVKPDAERACSDGRSLLQPFMPLEVLSSGSNGGCNAEPNAVRNTCNTQVSCTCHVQGMRIERQRRLQWEKARHGLHRHIWHMLQNMLGPLGLAIGASQTLHLLHLGHCLGVRWCFGVSGHTPFWLPC